VGRPDEVTMLGLISACANRGALDPAKRVHFYVKNHARALQSFFSRQCFNRHVCKVGEPS